jgi:predicted nucleotidyltransferase
MQPVVLAYLFGSAARNQTHPFSDIDIALLVDYTALVAAQRLRFELMIEDQIVERCGLAQVDVRVINDAPLAVRGEVVTQGLLLFERDRNERIEFETMTRMAYFDFLPLLEELRTSFFADIKSRGLHGQRTKSRRHVEQSESVPQLSTRVKSG